MSSYKFMKPLNIKKVNIGSPNNPKFVNIGDYWDDEAVEKITDLIQEFQYLFPIIFSKMKGIAGELGEMNIPLKPDVKPLKQ